MVRRLILPTLIAVILSLSGCIVGDAIAHLAKLTQEGREKNAAPPPAATGETPAARREEAPPPPAAAPSRSDVSVETLSPPR